MISLIPVLSIENITIIWKKKIFSFDGEDARKIKWVKLGGSFNLIRSANLPLFLLWILHILKLLFFLIDPADHQLYSKENTDQCQHPSNCATTPPLTQQQPTDYNLGLMLSYGRGRCAVRFWHWSGNTIVHENRYSHSQQSFRSSQYSAYYTFYVGLSLLFKKP